MKNRLIPPTLAPEAIESWLRNNAKEAFDDETKHVFTDEELNAFARKSSQIGGSVIDLNTILKEVTEAVKKGTGSEGLTIDIPPTVGLESMNKERLELDGRVKTGYELIKRKVYGIPDDETAEMVYFDAVGNECEERRRPLSAKEQNEYLGLFIGAGSRKAANS